MELNADRLSPALASFRESLMSKIIGQDEAVEKVVELYQAFIAGMNPPRKPVGTGLFLGQTGVGKTRMVEALAEVLFGNSQAHIRIDCAEFQHSHEIAKLIGSPPGYLGHTETPALLTQKVINQWHTRTVKLCLILFDEIEKANDALWRLLLGVLDKASLTLGNNNRTDFSNCMIFMTSNCGSSEIGEADHRLGFSDASERLSVEKTEKIIMEQVRKKFSPEFFNRLDKVAIFNTLTDENYHKILEIELSAVQERVLLANGTTPFVFRCTDRMKNFLLSQGISRKDNARYLKRAIEKNLVCKLSNLMSTNQVKAADFVKVDYVRDKVTFTKEKIPRDIAIPILNKCARAAVVSGSKLVERQQYPYVASEDDIEF